MLATPIHLLNLIFFLPILSDPVVVQLYSSTGCVILCAHAVGRKRYVCPALFHFFFHPNPWLQPKPNPLLSSLTLLPSQVTKLHKKFGCWKTDENKQTKQKLSGSTFCLSRIVQDRRLSLYSCFLKYTFLKNNCTYYCNRSTASLTANDSG